MLELRDVRSGYGLGLVCNEISLSVMPGEVLALLGRNGMGKTSLLRTIMRMSAPALSGGTIRMGPIDLTAEGPLAAARAGLGYVPQGRRVFGSLNVMENLAIVARRANDGSCPWTPQRVLEVFPRLADRRNLFARSLSGGEQQMLAIGRALVTNPRILLLDEPSEGLAPKVVADVLEVIDHVRESEMAVLLAEQNHLLVKDVSDRIALMERGQIVLLANAEEVISNRSMLHEILGA